jgi:hypothetical protein
MSTTEESTQTKNRPIHEIRLGLIKAAIWPNETEHGVRYNPTVSGCYTDRQRGQWKDTERCGLDDFPVVCRVLDRAQTWILECAPKEDRPDAA